jgi:mannose/fructose-specific phosphotransferase system component IIA
VEVKIGVQDANRELVLESGETADDVQKQVASALGEADGVLVLTDTRGRKVIVPAAKLAYVELGTPSTGQVGFRSRS